MTVLSMASVSSIAELRTVNHLVNQTVYVEGYYTPGDGGGGNYFYVAGSTSADNGGTVIVAKDGARWKLSIQDAISVRQFGAKGDNVTDDQPAFQNAFNYIASVSTASELFIPVGNYRINRPIVYNQTVSVRTLSIVGENLTGTNIVFWGSGNLFDIHVPALDSYDGDFISIKNFQIRSASMTATSAISIIRATGPTNVPMLSIEDIYIYNHNGFGDPGMFVHAIYIENSGQFYIKNVMINLSDVATSCFYIKNPLNNPYFGARFLNCDFYGGTYGLKVDGWLESLYLTDCSAVGHFYPIYCDATGTTHGDPHFTAKGCHFNAKKDTMTFKNWRAILLTGNDIYSGVGWQDTDGTNINLENASKVTITGCTIEHGAVSFKRKHINMKNVQEFSITGNVMKNATQGGIIIYGTSGKGVISSNQISGYVAAATSNEAIYNAGSVGLNLISNNYLDHFTTGILLNSDTNIISSNIFCDMQKGIELVGSTNTKVNDNVYKKVDSGTL